LNKKAFTLVELVMVIWIMFLLFSLSFMSLWKGQARVNFDESSYTFLSYLRDLRTIWMTNYIEESLVGSWVYKIPDNWYWFEFSDQWTGSMLFKLFYNQDEDVKFSSWDVVIKEWISKPYSMFIEDIYWSWSVLNYPSWNSTGNLISWSWVWTWTILFRNNVWEFPNDGSAFISTWSWSNNLSNITFEFYTNLDNQKKMRRVMFDRTTKVIATETCRNGTGATLELCWVWKSWVEWF